MLRVAASPFPAALALLLLLSGCGQKGALKLPPTSALSSSTPATTPQTLNLQPTFLRGVASDLNTANAQQGRPL
jgi:predicted small lipoprotein YifL